MNSDDKKPTTASELRQARLEQELRANLQKRKAQARARRGAAQESADPQPPAPNPLPPGPRSD